MKNDKKPLHIWIGVLTIILFIGCLIPLAQRSLRPQWGRAGVCRLYAEVSNIGELKISSPVRLGGVQIGCVKQIRLDPKTLRAKIEIAISKEICLQLPSTTELKITSSFPFGETFINLRVINPTALNSSQISKMKSGDTFIRAIAYQSLEETALALIRASKNGNSEK